MKPGYTNRLPSQYTIAYTEPSLEGKNAEALLKRPHMRTKNGGLKSETKSQ